jgi:hypothetical protein
MQTNFERTATVPASPRGLRLLWIAPSICQATVVVRCFLAAFDAAGMTLPCRGYFQS